MRTVNLTAASEQQPKSIGLEMLTVSLSHHDPFRTLLRIFTR